MNRKVKGYMTIEATLVFPIVLTITLVMMGLSFYVYNRVIVKECVYEALVDGGTKSEIEEKLEKLLEQNGVSLDVLNMKIKDGLPKQSVKVDARVNLLWITSVDMTIHVDEDLTKWETVKSMRLLTLGKRILNKEDKNKDELE